MTECCSTGIGVDKWTLNPTLMAAPIVNSSCDALNVIIVFSTKGRVTPSRYKIDQTLIKVSVSFSRCKFEHESLLGNSQYSMV